ncbi:MAG: hypothetical protein NZ846_01185 [Thermus sp.]|uniref:hypothetical protein n=1 Tax=unclassified Thermus TaxID=2619321 RepID=UPI00023891DB|nr:MULTISPECIES: hypothetical protein [unclassified Thermus]AEV16481.1 hypothetical protein TCCBUS3UF1_14400 [Thermus sp. CCB_US3_UF1]MCS6868052.1 hypothetical protein [Thermus sp.]MCS7217585.1 hypothetical protein [Thermus sp.]MDW8017663.1 hypothetical protein [Thermus sp.]MDW8356922.1 hypothetical protein [Thermus sp.]
MDHEEREMILELFPGTSPDLLPLGEILYYRDGEGRVVILEKGPPELRLELEPLPGSATTPQVCEACRRHLSGSALGFFRHPVGGRAHHLRYLVLCLDTASCASHAEPERLREILLRGILT